MKKAFLRFAAAAVLFGLGFTAAGAAAASPAAVVQELFAVPLAENQAAFIYLGYSAVIIRTAKGAVIIDPAGQLLKEDIEALRGKKVDAILFTHGHGDHFMLDAAVDLAKATGAAVGGESQIVQAIKKGGAIPADKIVDFGTGGAKTLGPWTITAIQGQHIGSIVLFHLAAGGINLFHGGDSAYVPVKNLSAGLAFLPAGAPSPTASPEAALKMAQDLKPRIVVLFHGSDAQYTEFKDKAKAALTGTEVIVPDKLRVYAVKIP